MGPSEADKLLMRETIEINGAVLIQNGAQCCNTEHVSREPRNSDRVESIRPVFNLHDFFRRDIFFILIYKNTLKIQKLYFIEKIC